MHWFKGLSVNVEIFVYLFLEVDIEQVNNFLTFRFKSTVLCNAFEIAFG